MSTNHPNNYPNNHDITTTLDAGRGKVVEVTFTDLNTENEANCGYDWVKVENSDGTDALPKTCGTTKPAKFRSTTRVAKVIFHSDGSEVRSGFRLDWEAVTTAVPVDGGFSSWSSWGLCSNNRDGKAPCRTTRSRYCNNPPASNGGADCVGASDEWRECGASELVPNDRHPNCVLDGGWSSWGQSSRCNSNCQSTRTRTCTNPTPVNSRQCEGISSQSEACSGGRCASSDSGTVTSPNYPEEYMNDQDVTKVLEVATGFKIELIFKTMDIEPYASCRYDFVEVLDTNGAQLGKYCGTTVPTNHIISSGNRLTVRFFSDNSITHTGFEAEWKKVTAADSGSIQSPNYPNNYPDNEEESWTLHVTGGRVRLTFTDFDVEYETNCGYDSVEIIDTDDSTSLGKFCGTSIPGPVTSTGDHMTVKFKSDYSETRKGFSANWGKV